MPEAKPKEHKCSHHTATMDKSVWRKFHFSGKVIMCSVLFGLGLVLVGGLVLAIGTDQSEDEKSGEQNQMRNKAPMSIVGPVIMGIGGFTVIVGIIMCFFETNICRKKGPDSRPLIEEQAANAEITKSSDQMSVPSAKRDKHKRSPSPKKHKRVKDSLGNSSKHSSSRDFTASENFLTPPSSFIPESNVQNPNFTTDENTKSLVKSITSSGKSWATSTEFQTPASSLQESCGSFEAHMESSESTPKEYTLEVPETSINGLSPHEFVSPMNSYVEGNLYAQISPSPNASSSKEETKESIVPVKSETAGNPDAIESDQKSKSEDSKNESSDFANKVCPAPEIVESADENSAVNNEIEVLDRRLEDIEQLKASQVPVHIDSININEQTNITALNDPNIINNTLEKTIPNGT